VICPGCQRDNDPKRRYCGRCGTNFQPVCRRCSFANAPDDRFCGGCGAMLVAAEGCHVRRTEPVAPAPVQVGQTVSVVAAPSPARGELSELFASPVVQAEEPKLPQTGVSQDDLDRLFGVAL
jgi:predicted amidophosphoribosyltransferase